MTETSPSSTKLSSGSEFLTRVSIVITCYNQGRFLNEAIESVLRQTYPAFEIIIIDDGSTDNTAEVAYRQTHTRYFRQSNQGLAAARNRGIREGRGDFFVFLDADDRLLPNALEAGLSALAERPECAFAFGDYRDIAYDGTVLLEPKREVVQTDYYLELLRGNFIGMHATVIYRRAVFQVIGMFNNRLKACEDYDLYLRVARQLSICHHAVLVAEYRKHDSNMSGDPGLMLKYVLLVLRSQKKHIKNDSTYRAYKAGLQSFAGSYAIQLALYCWAQLNVPNQRRQAIESFLLLWRYYPLGTVRCLARFCARRLPGISIIRLRSERTRRCAQTEDARNQRRVLSQLDG